MIVGVIAPVLGVLIIRKDLKKGSVVDTPGFIGNLLKIAAFTLVGLALKLIVFDGPRAIRLKKVAAAAATFFDAGYFTDCAPACCFPHGPCHPP